MEGKEQLNRIIDLASEVRKVLVQESFLIIILNCEE